jgi:hypothetical protein
MLTIPIQLGMVEKTQLSSVSFYLRQNSRKISIGYGLKLGQRK